MDKIMKAPAVTVLMPIYNGQDYVKDAIDSILSETFSDFEFLIIDDGSKDKSAEIIKSYKDPRIKYVSNVTNRGLPTTLNLGIELARGEFIARMDCDDISLPQRLERQVDFMRSHPEVSACGTWIKTIGDAAGFVNKYFTDSGDIKASLLFNTSLAHPSVIMRRSALNKLNIRYSTHYRYFEEDYALWIELSKYTELANIPEVLLLYRIHKKSVSHINISNRQEGISILRKNQLETLGLYPSEGDMYIHNSLHPTKGENLIEFIVEEEKWLIKITNANMQADLYSQNSLSKIIYTRWRTICGMNAGGGLEVWNKFVRSLLYSNYNQKNTLDGIKILIKCLLRMH
jgi:glycosyltransferase involved in cell wall biosynthesis